MRDYQSQKNNPYKLPDTLYRRMLDIVRDYERMNKERQTSSGLVLSEQNRECEAVEQAILTVPDVYRKGILENIYYRTPYPILAGEATFKRWKQKFIFQLAKNLYKI